MNNTNIFTNGKSNKGGNNMKNLIFTTSNEYGYVLRIFEEENRYKVIFFNKAEKVYLYKGYTDIIGRISLCVRAIRRKYHATWIEVDGHNTQLDLTSICDETIQFINKNKTNTYYKCKEHVLPVEEYIQEGKIIQCMKETTRTRGGHRK